MNRLLSLLNLPSIWGISRLIITNPRKLYTFMPQSGGYGDPVIFVTIMSAIASALLLLGTFLELSPGASSETGSIWQNAIYFILSTLAGIIFSFLLATIMFAIWNLFGSEQDFEVAYRCIAYSCVLLPIFAIARFIPLPYLGAYGGIALAGIWWCGLITEANQVVHQQRRLKMIVLFVILYAAALFFVFQEQQTKQANEGRLEQFNDQMRALEQRASELDP